MNGNQVKLSYPFMTCFVDGRLICSLSQTFTSHQISFQQFSPSEDLSCPSTTDFVNNFIFKYKDGSKRSGGQEQPTGH